MKNLKRVKSEERCINKEIAILQKKLKLLHAKLNKRHIVYRYRCSKCGLAFKKNELGYKVYKTVRTMQKCQPMGDYDIWQETLIEKLGCCPKCGHNFDVQVEEPEILEVTPCYGRWDGREHNFGPCGSKCISSKIMRQRRADEKKV